MTSHPPLPASSPSTAPRANRRAAHRSRIAAGALSVAALLGLGVTMAVSATDPPTVATATVTSTAAPTAASAPTAPTAAPAVPVAPSTRTTWAARAPSASATAPVSTSSHAS